MERCKNCNNLVELDIHGQNYECAKYVDKEGAQIMGKNVILAKVLMESTRSGRLKMIDKLYIAKNGTPHVVRALETVREFTKGEKMENTATTEQVLLQRQKQESIARWTFYVDDLSYPKFTMQLETFERNTKR